MTYFPFLQKKSIFYKQTRQPFTEGGFYFCHRKEENSILCKHSHDFIPQNHKPQKNKSVDSDRNMGKIRRVKFCLFLSDLLVSESWCFWGWIGLGSTDGSYSWYYQLHSTQMRRVGMDYWYQTILILDNTGHPSIHLFIQFIHLQACKKNRNLKYRMEKGFHQTPKTMEK